MPGHLKITFLDIVVYYACTMLSNSALSPMHAVSGVKDLNHGQISSASCLCCIPILALTHCHCTTVHCH